MNSAVFFFFDQMMRSNSTPTRAQPYIYFFKSILLSHNLLLLEIFFLINDFFTMNKKTIDILHI